MIEFQVEWQDAPGVRDPVLERTWCRLTMDVDGQVVTRAIDHRSQSLRDGIYGSALPLCRWIVENWWCLQYEAYRFHRPSRSHDLARNVDHRAWVQRHSLRAVGEGGVLPDLMLFRDGDAIVVRWLPDESDATYPFLRFVGKGEARLAAQEVMHGLTDFVLRVLERVEEMDAPEVEALSRDWAAITTATPDERELCVWSARLGLDPYDPDELTDRREELLKASMSSLEGKLKGDLLDAATADALPADVHWIAAAHELALGSGLSAGNGPEMEYRAPRQTAHETGYECARRIRQHLFGANGSDSGAPVVVAYQGDDIKPERFRLARSLFLHHFATAQARRLVTPAHTWDQQASRAFAAEFLAPTGALAKQVAGPVSFSDIDKLGDEYRVSSLVIEHQIDNHQLGFVTDA